MRWTIVYLASALAFAQGTTPKPTPTEYDVHLSSGPLDIGAEYMVHSYSNGEQMFLAERFLVVEVALYPVMKTDTVTVDLSKFGLRLNHKNLLPAANPKAVADALRSNPYAIGRQSPISGGIGAGPINIPMGQPGPQDRRPPQQPRAPDPDAPGGIERTQVNPEEVLLQTALPPGPHKGAVSGFVYFFYTGKSSSLKSVELEYEGATLKLK